MPAGSVQPVFFATFDAPLRDPTVEVSRDLAVETLPLADVDTCVQRLRDAAPAPALVITDAPGARALDNVIAEARLFADVAVAVTVVRLPRLAARLLASIASSEAQATSLANAIALADLAPKFLYSEVLVGSIGKLDDPAPTMLQAARSTMPGSKFVIATGYRDEVLPPTSRRVPDGFAPLACSGVDDLPEWMRTLLDAAEGDARFSRLPPWGGVELFGNRRWAEIVSWDARAVELWSEQVRSMAFPMCHWCERPRVRDVCAFCGYIPDPLDGVNASSFDLSPAEGGTQ